MAKRRSGYISIDVTEYISEISDDDLLDEVSDRKLKSDNGPDWEEEVEAAPHELLVGRAAEALAILDRLINPKWPSKQACLAAFERTKS